MMQRKQKSIRFYGGIGLILAAIWSCLAQQAGSADSAADPCQTAQVPRSAAAAVIPIENMVDEGLYQSLKRRTQQALDDGATYIIYEINTFGGRVDSAIEIWEYFIHQVPAKAHTVAYIPAKAISAGALIAVACQDIFMKQAATLGDCAPISLGGTLEGVEREKMESPLRTYFENAANQNGYPAALCQAMVTMDLEVFQVKNNRTGFYEYFLTDALPTDPCDYDLEAKKIVVPAGQLATFTADKAYEYGLSRKTISSNSSDYKELLSYLEARDTVSFEPHVATYFTNWSEELVRWINSPVVSGILLMIGMIGVYAELNSPGLGLPGAIALIAFAVLFGGKFLIGLANWWEIGLFLLGFVLLLVEIFVLPGFGVAGIAGILLMIASFVAMMIENKPDKLPIPASEVDWDLLETNLVAAMLGCLGFIIAAIIFSKNMDRIPLARRMVLAHGPGSGGTPQAAPAPTALLEPEFPVKVGEQGTTLTALRPAGMARFNQHRLDVVAQNAFIEAGKSVIIIQIEGNRIVVKDIS